MNEILCFPRNKVPTLPPSGVTGIGSSAWMAERAWIPRDIAESDESHLQAIVYFILLDAAGRAWCYRRQGGDPRLTGACSCGIGGHVERQDQTGPDTFAILASALRRELGEELGAAAAASITSIDTVPRAMVYEGLSAVGRVHLGLLYCGTWVAGAPPEELPDQALEPLGFRPLEEIAGSNDAELWSRLAAKWLAGNPP